MNFARAKLQYEILGLSAEDIADESGLAPYMLEDKIESSNWHVIWPALDLTKIPDSEKADRVLEDSTMRLKVFNALLAVHLAPKYLELEVSMLDAAIEAMKDPDLTPSTLASISRVYTSLRNHASSAILSDKEDNLGMPKVTIKNLSGSSITELENLGILPGQGIN